MVVSSLKSLSCATANIEKWLLRKEICSKGPSSQGLVGGESERTRPKNRAPFLEQQSWVSGGRLGAIRWMWSQKDCVYVSEAEHALWLHDGS